jgi:hypothetical protein
MDKITQTSQTLVFDKRVHPAVRVVIFLVGLLPLLAPYELLIRVRWNVFFSLPFFISLLFSIFLAAFSVFIVFIALFAQNQHVCFDGYRSTLTYGWSDAVRTYRETTHRFQEISEPELKVHDWSDGPNSYDLLVKTRIGDKINFAGLSLGVTK